MEPRLDLETSKIIYDVVGDYETEKRIISDATGFNDNEGWMPSPSFGELIRVLPKIGEKKGWPIYETFKFNCRRLSNELTAKYMDAPSPEEGMKLVGEYLRTLLK